MEMTEFRKNAADMIYLTACAVNSRIPKKERIEKLDLPKLFEVCQDHILTACAAYALESAGVKDNDFTQAKEKSVRKNIILDAERRNILKRLEQEHIWYMPLKGAILKDWYPKLGMRQMSDNDILCDNNFRSKIRDIMKELGFSCEHYMEGNDDAYHKPPVSNFEMHNELFMLTHAGNLNEYYSNVKERLIKDDGNDYGWHFSMEDFYIYMIAHEYKHFTEGGTGVRSLLDIYIFQRREGNSIDRRYIDAELAKLGITEFERNSSELAMKLFSMRPLTHEDKKLLDFFVMSGTYGNFENHVASHIERNGNNSKLKYIWYRIFPPVEYYRDWYNFAYRHKILLPAAWVFRILRGLTVRRKKLTDEIKVLTKK